MAQDIATLLERYAEIRGILAATESLDSEDEDPFVTMLRQGFAEMYDVLKIDWIPCEERWPTKTDLYWVCWHECLRRKKSMIAEWLQRGKVWYLEGKYYRPGTVLAPSHWAEVSWPEPPAGCG